MYFRQFLEFFQPLTHLGGSFVATRLLAQVFADRVGGDRESADEETFHGEYGLAVITDLQAELPGDDR